jgi:salicylate hydroxylase
MKRLRRNALLRARDTYDYSFTDWLYSTTALTPAEEPALFRPISLDSYPERKSAPLPAMAITDPPR